MGITAIVERESGDAIDSLGDPHNILHRVLPEQADQTFRHLNCIDWYGNTIFNRIQIPEVRRELQRLAAGLNDGAELALIEQLDALAAQALSGVHLYLKFYGD